MSEKVYVGSVIADIHWGAVKPQILYEELKKTILNKLEKLPVLDFIVIVGDYFDDKTSLNSVCAKYAFEFLYKLLDICLEKDAKLRIIKGTESHDNKQLELFEVFQKMDKYDFKIISTVSSEDLFDDLKVLYIPEEYIKNKDEYYKDFFDKEYDMIFAHGLVNEVKFIATKQESESTMAKAPIFKSIELLNICKGPVFFGHIHIPQVIQDRLLYVGSISRWCFGEEQDKGFYLVTYKPEDNDFITEFIVNKWAKRYDTIVVDCNSTVFKTSANEQIDFLLKLVSSLNIDFIRLEINIPEDYPDTLLFINLINDTFNKYPNVKLKVINTNKTKKEKEVEKKINILLEKYSFLFTKTLSYEEKISRYMKEKYNKNMSLEKLREYLYQDITKGGLLHDK